MYIKNLSLLKNTTESEQSSESDIRVSYSSGKNMNQNLLITYKVHHGTSSQLTVVQSPLKHPKPRTLFLMKKIMHRILLHQNSHT